jgi:hypothetical protein
VKDDRRAKDRLPIEVPALFVREPGDSDVWTGYVVNLSEGGACLVTDQPIAPGTDIYVGFFLEGFGGLPIIAMGKVIWANAEESTVGLAFSQAGPAQRVSVERLRDSLAAKRRELLAARAGS